MTMFVYEMNKTHVLFNVFNFVEGSSPVMKYLDRTH